MMMINNTNTESNNINAAYGVILNDTGNQQFADAMKAFLTGAQAIVSAYDERMLNDAVKAITGSRTTLHTSVGKAHVRVFKTRHVDQHSLYCFVEIATGNIYKGKGWKAPDTKIVRGNIYSYRHGLEGVDYHGARYAR